MPRERRRRRSRRASPRPAAPQPAPSDGQPRSWWWPRLSVFTAGFGGLWLGSTLALSDVIGGIALFVGAIGFALGLSRMLGAWLRTRRLRAAQRRGDSDSG